MKVNILDLIKLKKFNKVLVGSCFLYSNGIIFLIKGILRTLYGIVYCQ
jgi:hypothetical protein